MISLWYFLAFYIFFVVLGFVFLFFNLFHIARFSPKTTPSILVLIFYILFFFSVLAISVATLSTIDWTQSFTVEQIFGFTVSASVLGL